MSLLIFIIFNDVYVLGLCLGVWILTEARGVRVP